jgi:hypothetical protein
MVKDLARAEAKEAARLAKVQKREEQLKLKKEKKVDKDVKHSKGKGVAAPRKSQREVKKTNYADPS